MSNVKLWIVSILAASPLACGGPEQSAIGTFLEAVQSKDDAARSAVSTVDFPGEVGSWQIVDLGTESTETFRLPELHDKAQEAKRNLDLENEKAGYFIRDNKRLYERYQAEIKKDPDVELKGELGKFQEQWQAKLEKQKELEAKLEAASGEVQKERATAAISLMGGSVTDDFEGEVAVRQVLVNVRGPQGDETPYRFTLRRYNLVNKRNNMKPRSRWIITDVQKQG